MLDAINDALLGAVLGVAGCTLIVIFLRVAVEARARNQRILRDIRKRKV